MKSAVLATENTKATKVRLGALISEAKPIRCNNRDLPVLSMTMKDGLVLQSEKFKKRVASEDVSNYKVVSSNQLVVSFPIDEGVLAVQQIVEEGIVSPAYAIWNIDEDKVIPKYLESYLRSPSSLHYYKSKLRGTTVRRRSIPKSDFLAMELVLPTLKNQEMALQKLDLITEMIRNREAQLARLDTLVKSKFEEMFGDPIKPNAKKYPLRDLCVKLTDGTHSSPENLTSGQYKYITAKNIKKSGLDLSEVTYVSKGVHEEIYSRCNPELGDVLYIKDGATTGIAVVNSLREEFSLLSSVALIKHDREKIDGHYLVSVLNHGSMYRYVRGLMGGCAITRLTLSKINELPIPLPPLSLQKEFAAVVEEVDKSKAAIKKTIENLKTLYKARLQEYFA